MSGRATTHVARKRFGQNFLVDRAVVASIVRAVDPRPTDAMVEIGPGLAALTEPLIAARDALRGPSDRSYKPLQAVELDRDLAGRLRKRFPAEQLTIHEADALAFDFGALAGPDARLRIVGNLPYNISTPLLFHLREIADRVADQHFMLQKEVVARMVAEPGTSDFGRLSVMLQVRYDMDALFDVPPGAFDPQPLVTSAIVRMIPLPASALTIRDPARFARIVTTAFGQRRKMLRNTLQGHEAAMEAVSIVPTARAEEVAPQTWIALANHEAGR